LKPLHLPTADPSFQQAFAIAKEALKHVGTFQTPPTPQIYELWYRYVEGTDQDLATELGKAIESNDLSEQRITDIRQRYFPPAMDSELQRRASQTLASEVEQLQATLRTQFDAGQELQDALISAGNELTDDELSPEMLSECITAVLISNEAMQTQLKQTNQRLEVSEAQIKDLQQELLRSQKTMLTDSLTQVGNRRLFESTVESIMARVRLEPDTDRLTALILVDLDEFKRVNDGFGHSAGDDLLVYVGGELQRRCAAGTVARIGGDEFAILSHVASAAEASELGDELRQHFAQQSLLLNRTGQELGKVTLSLGIALLRADDTRESWYNRADQLLYASKSLGGNHVSLEPKIGR